MGPVRIPVLFLLTLVCVAETTRAKLVMMRWTPDASTFQTLINCASLTLIHWWRSKHEFFVWRWHPSLISHQTTIVWQLQKPNSYLSARWSTSWLEVFKLQYALSTTRNEKHDKKRGEMSKSGVSHFKKKSTKKVRLRTHLFDFTVSARDLGPCERKKNPWSASRCVESSVRLKIRWAGHAMNLADTRWRRARHKLGTVRCQKNSKAPTNALVGVFFLKAVSER